VSPIHRWSTATLYALTVAGYPLIATLPIVLGLPSRTVSIPYRAGYFALALFVLAQNIRRNRVYFGPAWLPLGLFWLLYTFRLASDLVFFPITVKLPPLEYFAWAFGSCVVPMLAFFSRPDDRTLELAVKTSAIAASLACLLALYSSYLALLSGMSDTFATGRLGTETLPTIEFGYLGAVTILLAAWGIFRWRATLVRFFLVIAIVIALFMVGAAASRGPILALGIIDVGSLEMRMRGKSLRSVTGATILTLFAAVLLLGGLTLLEQEFGFRGATRLSSVESIQSEQSGEEHLRLAAGAWSDFLDHPVLGSAVDEQRSHDYPHNVLIESFMATGTVGGLAFSAVLLAGLAAALRLLDDQTGGWVALVYLLLLFAALTSGALYLAGGMWCFGCAVTAVGSDRRLRTQGSRSAVVS
jgi:hypothetical protein